MLVVVACGADDNHRYFVVAVTVALAVYNTLVYGNLAVN